jgi:hypothetical protein
VPLPALPGLPFLAFPCLPFHVHLPCLTFGRIMFCLCVLACPPLPLP